MCRIWRKGKKHEYSLFKIDSKEALMRLKEEENEIIGKT